MSIKFLQLILIVGTIGVIIYLLRIFHAVKLEKRIGNFAIVSIEDDSVSVFDKVNDWIMTIIRLIAKVISKSKVLSKYGKKYEKFITFDERNEKEGIYYVALKFFLLIIVFILMIISLAIHPSSFDFLLALLMFLLSFFLPDIVLNIQFNKKRARVEEDLLKAIIIMNNAFQSGRNIMQAVEIVKNELDGPIEDEFKKIYLDISYGLGLEVVFKRFYERVKLDDAKYITTSLALLNKTGGDIVKVFSMIEKSIFDKKNLKNELNSLTASSKFVFKFLIALPFIFVLLIFVLNPSYFMPLFNTTLGIVSLIIILMLYTIYIIVIRKILEVKL